MLARELLVKFQMSENRVALRGAYASFDGAGAHGT